MSGATCKQTKKCIDGKMKSTEVNFKNKSNDSKTSVKKEMLPHCFLATCDKDDAASHFATGAM